MRVFYCGFNLYGQFIQCRSFKVDHFEHWKDDEMTNIHLHHTYSIIVKGKDVFLCSSSIIKKINLPDNFEISQTCCTDKFVLFLSMKGCLLKLEVNKDIFETTTLPWTFFNEKDALIKIAFGNKISVAFSREGKLFTLPNKLNFINKNIVDLCAGHEHCVLLDNQGNIYTFGRGSRGQLGHGNLEDQIEPEVVQGLSGIKISKIAAGGWHSCAVSEHGDLYTWGWNGNGQLGIGKDFSIMALPHVVKLRNEDDEVVKVACGNRHTLALMSDGKLFGMGWNKYCQLGKIFGDCENLQEVNFLYDFSGLNVIDLKCGPWNSAVIVN